MHELANVIERAVVLGHGPQLTLRDLPPRVLGATSQAPEAATELTYHAAIIAYRRNLIRRALAQAQGSRAAAKILGLQRTHLQRLLKALHIDD